MLVFYPSVDVAYFTRYCMYTQYLHSAMLTDWRFYELNYIIFLLSIVTQGKSFRHDRYLSLCANVIFLVEVGTPMTRHERTFWNHVSNLLRIEETNYLQMQRLSKMHLHLKGSATKLRPVFLASLTNEARERLLPLHKFWSDDPSLSSSRSWFRGPSVRPSNPHQKQFRWRMAEGESAQCRTNNGMRARTTLPPPLPAWSESTYFNLFQFLRNNYFIFNQWTAVDLSV